jgi:hypothetical protein
MPDCCPICLCALASSTAGAERAVCLPRCGHTVCGECIARWYKKSQKLACPLCRADQTPELAYVRRALLHASRGQLAALRALIDAGHVRLDAATGLLPHETLRSHLRATLSAGDYADVVPASPGNTNSCVSSPQ